MRDEATFAVKVGLARMLEGGVIMDVVDPEGRDIAALRLSVSRVERDAIEPGVALLAESVKETRSRSSVIESAPVI